MLTEQEKKDIETELEPYEHKRAGCVEALKVVQRHRGWVSDEALVEIAGFIGMTPDELDDVATFYSLIFREPVGRHVILLCDSISCWIVGQQEVFENLKARLGIADWGQTTSDGKFTLLPVACLGACDHAPAMMIDDELYGDLTPQKLDQILGTFK